MNSQTNVQPPARRRLFEGEQHVEEIRFGPDEVSIGSPPKLMRSTNEENAFHTPIPYEEDDIVASVQEPYPIVAVSSGARNEIGFVQIPRTITGSGPTRVVYEYENQVQENNEAVNYNNCTQHEGQHTPVNTITYYDCTGASFTVNENNPIS